MCGICGFFFINEPIMDMPTRERVIKKMSEILRHRGPDEDGFYHDEWITLGHTRLSIIDLTTGRQPIHNEDSSVWVVFNGEIYNYLELREELKKKGHFFYTKSDTEVIVHLYEELEEECIKKLDGMFAFCIWDKKKRKMLLVRDRIGEKPLYWAATSDKVIFASELKAIIDFPGFEKEIDHQTLRKYFLYGFIPAPETIFKSIRKVLPGYFIVLDKHGKVQEKQYWEIDYSSKLKEQNNEEIKNETLKYLIQAVRKRLVSDVPLGVLLSGGVDSSLVAAIMAQIIPPSHVHAFTIGFQEKAFDESEYAKLVSEHLKINHHLKIFRKDEVLDVVPKIADFLDEPMTDPSILPTFLLSDFAHKDVKVVLSGDGGDENFAGYPKYLAHFFLSKSYLDNLPLSCLSIFFAGKINSFLRYASFPLYLRNQLWINPFSLKEVNSLLGETKESYADILKYHLVFNGKDFLDEAFFLDQKLTLADLYLVKTDRASMAASLEIRSPFLDVKLTEFVAQIPFGLKMKGFKTKSFLKDIAVKFLPKEAIFRPKMGFGIPLSDWLRNELKPMITKIFAIDKIQREGVLNPGFTEKIVKRGNFQQIWTLLVFELWYRRWIENKCVEFSD